MLKNLLCGLRRLSPTSFLQSLISSIESRFKCVLKQDDSDFEPVYIVATFLDPFLSLYLDHDVRTRARRELRNYCRVPGVHLQPQEETYEDQEKESEGNKAEPGFLMFLKPVVEEINSADPFEADMKTMEARFKEYRKEIMGPNADKDPLLF
ncbi:uncharacterized protein LOC111716260 [Eurytemora carolleeae]|uniref:uncharacterized protein LOC111716260 n=1 Tax=Eurytemora carolleeae TaxID=1294199 RepID=UPI000C78E22B|nr:uncharacterized protein LOC111716260 [Eurytemora carolleeae]|eukprot:XP_023347464.1 uncharacterized protein LOC111716260 [Eurytemora affinis]